MAVSRRGIIFLAFALIFAATAIGANRQLARRSGLTRTVYGEPGFPGMPLRSDRTDEIDLTFLDRDRHLPRRFFSVRWQGVWHVPKSATYQIVARADDRVVVSIDGRRAIERSVERASGPDSVELTLGAGAHAIDVTFEQFTGGAFLGLRAAEVGEEPKPLPPDQLFPAAPTRGMLWLVTVLRAVRLIAWICAALAGIAAFVVIVRTEWRRPWLAFALVLLLATALRLDALLARYGPLERPAWAAELQLHGADRLALLRPDGFGWLPEPRPYVGGDPIAYLRFAREMRHFYAAHVREPLFVYATKLWLGALEGQDVAISFASLTFSVLLVAATYALGAAAFSRSVGLLAAVALAIERDAIAWSVDGWRDDAFAAFVVLFAWALVRCHRAPSLLSALLAGVIGAAACLTRLSSLTFILPGLIALIGIPPTPAFAKASARSRRSAPGIHAREGGKRRATAALIAFMTMTALTLPYLINCARQFGDPFYAVNYHTAFYQGREDRARRDTTAASYVGSKITQQPLRSLRVGAIGLTTYPFLNKWGGFHAWLPGLGIVLAIAAVAGLLSWLRSDIGRLLLVVLMTSLAPYALTWPIRGGAEWRFTLHAYPFYLIAAALSLSYVAQRSRAALPFKAAWAWAGRPEGLRYVRMGRLLAVGIVASVCSLAAARWWPWLEFREALQAKEAATIAFGERDAAFLGDGWSRAVRSGDRQVRFATAVGSTLLVPLPDRRDYLLRLRLDPFEEPLRGRQRVAVFFNKTPIGAIVVGETPERDGAYELAAPAAAVRVGRNRIDLFASQLVPVRTLRSRAAGLSEQQAAAFRMWDLTIK